MKKRLIKLLKEHSVMVGNFFLASGKQSDFYIDVRQITLHPEGALLIANMILNRINSDIQGVGGPMTGADPIAGAVSVVSYLRGKPIYGFMIRKKLKAYGSQYWIEGRNSLPNGSHVCIVEDTTTTGNTLLRAIYKAEQEGLIVKQCISVVDREEGAMKRITDAGYSFEALVTRTELIKENK